MRCGAEGTAPRADDPASPLFWSLNAIDVIQRSVEKASTWMWRVLRLENAAVRIENG